MCNSLVCMHFNLLDSPKQPSLYILSTPPPLKLPPPPQFVSVFQRWHGSIHLLCLLLQPSDQSEQQQSGRPGRRPHNQLLHRLGKPVLLRAVPVSKRVSPVSKPASPVRQQRNGLSLKFVRRVWTPATGGGDGVQDDRVLLSSLPHPRTHGCHGRPF